MNKLTKKLLLYFAVLETFLVLTVFIGFSFTFHHYTITLHESEMRQRVETIASRLGEFMDMEVHPSGRGAYLRFLEDISMADTYLISVDGGPFSMGISHRYVNDPTEAAAAFAGLIFSEDSFVKKELDTESGRHKFLMGMPVKKDGVTVAAVVIEDEDTIDRKSFAQAMVILGVCLLVSLMLSIAASCILSRRFMKPIQQIARTVRELAGGKYETKTNIEDATELGDLAKETDILADKLEQARVEGQRLQQLQKDFFADISHELRTPVTVLRSSLEAICDGVVSGEKALEYQHQMLEETISLQRLVNDMLELSRLQNVSFPIRKDAMNGLMALEDAIRAVRVLARGKQIRIQYDKADAIWMMDGDYGRIRQMFVAALDNAIKYSDEGQTILVTAERLSDEAGEISIRDHGCGISAEAMQNVFHKFYRASGDGATGSGLGLAIIKGIGDRHAIDVSLSSTPGEGTVIHFRMPIQEFQEIS